MDTITVDGIEFRACPEQGAWYEADDPNPNGSVGRLYIPMMADGSPATYDGVPDVGEIEVAYEDA